MNLIVLLATLFACTPEEELFDRNSFENEWWEIDTFGYNACFLVHSSHGIFIYEEEYGVYPAGYWEYEEPGIYHVESESIDDIESLEVKKKKDCWKISGYSILKIEACACTLISD